MLRIAVGAFALSTSVAFPAVPAQPDVHGFSPSLMRLLDRNTFAKKFRHFNRTRDAADTGGRKLADCSLLDDIVEKTAIMLAMVTIPLANMNMNTAADVMCKTGEDAHRCAQITDADLCISGCEWDNVFDLCNVFAYKQLGGMFPEPPSPTSPYGSMVASAKACNGMNEASCTGDCEWSSWDHNCDPTDQVLSDLACTNADGAALLALTKTCNAVSMFDKDGCENTEGCHYEDLLFTCGIADQSFLELAYGSSAGAKLGEGIGQNVDCLADLVWGCTSDSCELSVLGCGPAHTDLADNFEEKAIDCAMDILECDDPGCQRVHAECVPDNAAMTAMCPAPPPPAGGGGAGGEGGDGTTSSGCRYVASAAFPLLLSATLM